MPLRLDDGGDSLGLRADDGDGFVRARRKGEANDERKPAGRDQRDGACNPRKR